ncbi:hypothetical protein, conserved [Eimeria maxima]|uniref:Transmembrane protein n=1 Tax=Eimeria maxima TaxID=5804 RepID=U6MCA4_EIMMA|nr:hypothetical protein, conserved [Eimeria maxima]CDJ59305.1 hypothetical protein, conserved [Eimeria maxima]
MFGRSPPWKYSLSLGSAAWVHSFLLAAAGAWNLVLFLGVFPLKRSLTEAAVMAYSKRSLSVATALRSGFLTLAITFLLISLLTDIALCCRSKRAAYALAWLNIFASFLGLLLLMYLWTAFGILLLSTNATVGELVVWGNLDLLYVILTAVPMTKVYASLGNVFAAGGTGFEGLGFEEVAEARDKKAADIKEGRTLKMGALGTWRVGLSLEHSAVLFSLFCFAVAILDLSIFWVKISDDPLSKMNTIGIMFLVEGILMFATAISALAGSAAAAPFFTLIASIFTLLALPLSLTLVIMLCKRLFYDLKNIPRALLLNNYAALHALGAQTVLVLGALFAFAALYSLFCKQTSEAQLSESGEKSEHVQRIDLEAERQKLLPEPETLNP